MSPVFYGVDSMKIIFIFIDGFGIGEKDPAKNPIYAADAPHIRKMLDSESVFPTDACLGVPGLPQSATGQTAIFTGVNGASVLGRHLNGQPTITLKNIINQGNIFKTLTENGFKVTYSNVYRDEYLNNLHVQKDRRLRPSVTTVMALSCGMKFRNVGDFVKGRGIYHDITGRIIADSGYDVQVITPVEAARRLYRISRDYDFTLYEHFLSDIIGHKMDMGLAVKEIELLDAFLGELFRIADIKKDIIFITSDHGNIEDITVKTHTCNKVPTVVSGRLPEGMKIEIASLLDIMPAVLRLFGIG